MAFSLPVQKASVHGWGPSSNENLNKFTLYASYNKSDRLGKVADFTTHFHHSRLRHNTTNSVNGEFQYKHDTQDDASFELVDTVKVSKPKYAERLRPFASRVGRTNTRNNNNQGKAGNSPSGKNPHVRMKGQQQLNKRWDRLNNARRMYSTRKREEHRVDRPASVLVESSWEIVEQFELSQLTKLQMNRPEVEDLKWCGELSGFDDAYDRVNTKNEKKLRDFSQVTFRNESTSDDPVLEEFAKSDVGNVYATDAILALLMASTRSVNPWDIVVSSVGGKLFFDKRDGKYFDHEAVNETAFEGPVTEDVLDLNHPDNLAVEATLVKRYFSEQIVKEVVRKLENENPFKDGDQTAKVGYRYRKWTIGEDVQLVARCSLNGIAMKGGEEEFMAAFALNEWDSKLAKGIEWRSKIDSQRGAILATELKNNSCKLAKWTCQSILSGADQMKIGYVSRTNRFDATSHVVLGTHTYKPRDFAAQIALNVNNMWGILKMLIDLFHRQPEGKYVIMKDPNKSVVRICSVPVDTFDSSPDELTTLDE